MSWIYENYSKPDRCEKCGRSRNVFWFSKSRKNLEERDDWFALCNTCRAKEKVETNGYLDYLKETSKRKEKAKKELSEIENKIANNNYDEIIKQKNKTIKENKTLEENNYKLGIEIEGKKAEIEKIEEEHGVRVEDNNKKQKTENIELNRTEKRTEKLKKEIETNNNFIGTQKNEIKTLSKYIDEFSDKKNEIEAELNCLKNDIIKANKIIGKAGEVQKLIEEEKNAITTREHKADVRQRSLLRKYKRIGINITKF